MELSESTKLEILQINLDAIKSGLNDAVIMVDFETAQMWLNHLEGLERYEDCKIIKDNQHKIIFELATMIPSEYFDFIPESERSKTRL